MTDIAFDSDGTFVVVWEHNVNGIANIYAQRYLDDGSPLGGNFRVSTNEDTLRQGIPGVLLRNGKIFTSWSSSRKIWANIIDFYDPPEDENPLEPIIPLAYSLKQNYPNPFNPVTQIDFELPEDGFTKLVIYDLLGREIERLIDKDLNAGNHSVKWDASKFVSGLYFYRLQSGNFIQTKKMLLIR